MQRGVLIITKYNAAIEAYENNLSAKETSAKVAPYQEKLVSIQEEMRTQLRSLNELL